MNRKKIGILLGIIALSVTGGQTFAEEGDRISQLDKTELRELRKSGNRELFKQRARELGIKKSDRLELNQEQQEILANLRKNGNREDIKSQLNEWGIQGRAGQKKGLKKENFFDQLTEEQKSIIQDLRENDSDPQVIKQQLQEFGIQKSNKKILTEDQRAKIQELKESGDRQELREYFQQIGLKKTVKRSQEKKAFHSSLTEVQKDILKEAREIARSGDVDMAKDIITDLFAQTSIQDDTRPSRFLRFIKKNF